MEDINVHQQFVDGKEKQRQNIQSILLSGMVSTKDSVHSTAISEASELAWHGLPGIQLLRHQVENVMRACEARGKLPIREGSQTHVVLNIAVLCDSAGSGMMVSMIAHLDNTAPPNRETSEFLKVLRERTKEQKWRNRVVLGENVIRIDPSNAAQLDMTVDHPTTVIIAQHGVVDTWAEHLHRLTPAFKVKVVAKTSDTVGLLVDAPDIIVVSQTFYSVVSKQFAHLRLARVIYDDSSLLNIPSCTQRHNAQHVMLKGCFTWLIEPQLEVYLTKDAMGPDQTIPRAFRNTFTKALGSLEDMTPLLVRHSHSEVVYSMGLEFPHTTIYHCRGDSEYGYYTKQDWTVYRNNRLESATPGFDNFTHVLELGAEIVSKEDAVDLCESMDARARVTHWKEEACTVCWMDFKE
jgi:hypothetical protein